MSGKRLCEIIAKENGIPESFAKKILLDALSAIELMTLERGRCQIRGFGTFKLKTFAAKLSHDYATRKIIQLPAKTKLVFEHGRDRKLFTESVENKSSKRSKPCTDAASLSLPKK
jgi:nucleoid DNA-binding protein